MFLILLLENLFESLKLNRINLDERQSYNKFSIKNQEKNYKKNLYLDYKKIKICYNLVSNAAQHGFEFVMFPFAKLLNFKTKRTLVQ